MRFTRCFGVRNAPCSETPQCRKERSECIETPRRFSAPHSSPLPPDETPRRADPPALRRKGSQRSPPPLSAPRARIVRNGDFTAFAPFIRIAPFGRRQGKSADAASIACLHDPNIRPTKRDVNNRPAQKGRLKPLRNKISNGFHSSKTVKFRFFGSAYPCFIFKFYY